MTLKVTGSGFTKKKKATVEIDATYAGSGNFIQTKSVDVDGAGKISETITVFLNATCAIGVRHL